MALGTEWLLTGWVGVGLLAFSGLLWHLLGRLPRIQRAIRRVRAEMAAGAKRAAELRALRVRRIEAMFRAGLKAGFLVFVWTRLDVLALRQPEPALEHWRELVAFAGIVLIPTAWDLYLAWWYRREYGG